MFKNNVEIVVARYNEDLHWLNEYPFTEFEYTVYNKGDNGNFEKRNVKKIIRLPNVGRCDHTYLYHIVQNYDNLSGITIFFTGSVNLPHKKEKAITILNNIIASNYQSAYFMGKCVKNIHNRFYNFTLDSYRCSEHNNSIKNPETRLKKCRLRPYGKWYSHFFGNTIAHWATLSGVFSIDKRDIIQHPVSRYLALRNTVNRHSNPEAGHYIERSWGAIFFPMNFTDKIVENNLLI
jgi:hypothetical protein